MSVDTKERAQRVRSRVPEIMMSPELEGCTLADLARMASGGDHAAFADLHRRLGPGLRRQLLQRSGGREDVVDELSQRIWSSTWSALTSGKYDPSRAAITTYVYAIGHNAWLTHLRKFSREQGYVGSGPAVLGEEHLPAGAVAADGPAPEVLEQSELIDALRACLRVENPAGLTDPERVVIAAVAQGESDRGLARRLALSSSTVNIRKHAAFSKIRQYLFERGLASVDLPFDSQSDTQIDPQPAALPGGPSLQQSPVRGAIPPVNSPVRPPVQPAAPRQSFFERLRDLPRGGVA